MTQASQATGSAPFSPGEWEELQNEDKTAAKHIVSLMVGIFILGLAGYLAICVWIG